MKRWKAKKPSSATNLCTPGNGTSADVIFFEIFLAINWFNPIAYLYRNAIKNIHEFIADDSAASTLEDRSAYALLLVSSVFNTQPQRLTNNFFNQSLLKRRIIMLHKTKSRKVAILKYGLSVPSLCRNAHFFICHWGGCKNCRKNQYRCKPGHWRTKKNPAEDWERILKPTVQVVKTGRKFSKPTLVPVSRTTEPVKKTLSQETRIPDQPAEKLQEYIWTFFRGLYEETKLGRAWFSFDVDDQKHAVNFKLINSGGILMGKGLATISWHLQRHRWPRKRNI